MVMNLHQAKSKKKKTKINDFHRNLKMIATLALLVLIPLFLVGLNSAHLPLR